MARERYARKVTVFPMLSEGVYDTTPIKLVWTEKFETKTNYDINENLGDGTIEESESIIKDMDITLEISSQMSIEDLCKLTGQEYIKGMAITNVETTPVKCAISYEIYKKGDLRRRCLRNCYLTKDSQANETESKGEVYVFNGKAIGDENGDIDITMSEKEVITGADPEVKKVWDSFFTKCPGRPTTSTAMLGKAKVGFALLGQE